MHSFVCSEVTWFSFKHFREQEDRMVQKGFT